MMGTPKKGTPQEPISRQACEVQGGLSESALLPARVVTAGEENRPPGALSSYPERVAGGNVATLEDDPQNWPNPRALLGINGRTPAARASRGFQPIQATSKIVEQIDPDTGEILRFRVTKSGLVPYLSTAQLRAERYALKSVVNQLYPQSLTAKCSRMRIPGDTVRIVKNAEFQKAHFAGLCRCGNVWMDPLCASKIAERRRVELVAAVAVAKALGWQVYLLTATIPHGLGDDLPGILQRMLKAWRRMTDSRAGKAARRFVGLEGTVRALEVTDGVNGFHPHFHVLVFASGGYSPGSLQGAFLPLWQDACCKSGLPCPSDLHGLRVDDGAWAAKYASKWGLEDEMVRGHTKTARGANGRTPWDMLREILKTRCRASEVRFRLYAEAFRGRRQLYWSNGLKSRLGLDEVTDLDLVNREDESADQLAELTVEQWRAVLATRTEAVLLAAAEMSPNCLPDLLAAIDDEYLAKLKRMKPRI